MPRIATVVEGHGEVTAVPVLLRRIAQAGFAAQPPEIPRPIRVRRQRITRGGELHRVLELAARQAGAKGGILILLDADDDCPAQLGPDLLEQAVRARPDRPVRVVLAKAGYESWFLAAAESLAGRHRLASEAVPPRDAEEVRNAKRWLSRHLVPGEAYRPRRDQERLTRAFDMTASRRAAPSFDKFWRDVRWLFRQVGLKEGTIHTSGLGQENLSPNSPRRRSNLEVP